MKPVVNVTVGGQKKPTNYTYKTVILKSNLPFAEQVTESDCIYVIKWDFDLGSETVTIPENCVLEFEGGSLKNGTLIGQNTIIDSINFCIFQDVSFGGTFTNEYFVADWFVKDNNNASEGINSAVLAAYNTKVYEVRLTKERYDISSTINLFSRSRLIGIEGALNLQFTLQPYPQSSITVTRLYVTNEVDAIHVSVGSDDDTIIFNVVVKNLFINYKEGSARPAEIYGNNSIKTNHGIYISNNTQSDYSKIGLRECVFENLAFANFKYGFYFYGYGWLPFAGIKFNRCQFCYNLIGLVIEGVTPPNSQSSEDPTDKNPTWANCNNYIDCLFARNYLGGVYFKNLISQENNVFERCVMQYNGENYNPAILDDNTFEAKGFSFYGSNAWMIGTVYFDTCYFETNCLRREPGTPISGEEYLRQASDGNWIYPEDVQNICYNFWLRRSNAYITKCKFNAFVKLAYIRQSKFNLINNDYDVATMLDFKDNNDKDPYIIKVWCTGQAPTSVGTNININEPTPPPNPLKDNLPDEPFYDVVKYPVEFEGSSWVFFRSYVAIKFFDLPSTFINKAQEVFYDAYIQNSGTDWQLGTMGNPVKTTGHLDYYVLTNFVSPNNIVKVFASGNVGLYNWKISTGPDPDDFYYVHHKFGYNFQGDGHDTTSEKYTVLDVPRTSGSYQCVPKLIFNDSEFNDLLINNGTGNKLEGEPEYPVGCAAFEVMKGNTIAFNRCRIQLGVSDLPLITTKINDLTIIFNDCIFQMADPSKTDSNVANITDNMKNTVIYNNCSCPIDDDPDHHRPSPRGVTLIPYIHKGTTEERPDVLTSLCVAFEYFDTDLNKPIYWTGDSWVDANGEDPD